MMLPPIIEIDRVQEHLGELVLADVRWYPDGRSGHEAYTAGHVPGAVYVELERWLAGPGGPKVGAHPLPAPEVFAQGMSELGIGDDDPVVAYDDVGGVIAARLVWMLRATGHSAALLDGGLAAWPDPLEQDEYAPPPGRFTARPWPADRLAGIEDATDPANLVIDARDRVRYRGEEEPFYSRAGHIPRARNVPCRENLDAGGRLLDEERLRAKFAAAGVSAASGATPPIVSYCGSGITACHNLLVMEHLGLPEGRLYPGSWSHYSADPGRPGAIDE